MISEKSRDILSILGGDYARNPLIYKAFRANM